MKEQHAQTYQSKFEDLIMVDNKPFDDFYVRLFTIISQATGIGHSFEI